MAQEYQSICKDCNEEFGYSLASLQGGSLRGLSRPERCPMCRKQHSREGKSIGIPQIPVKARLPRRPTEDLRPGRLGKLLHPERAHKPVTIEAKFGRPDSHIEFGITDDDIRTLIDAMQKYQVVVVVGPTGSGKSTFLPYRLMAPPDGVQQDIFTRYGQIVITQPRTQPTRSISDFVARDLHGSSLGAGFDVGFRHRGEPASDWRNKLVYVTDGTLINWIVSGQISNLSVIMIDEAHERSLNIDLILGLLQKQLPRFPHLKLIIASATINAELFQNHFGGPEKVGMLKFRGLKQHTVRAFFPFYDEKLGKNSRYLKNDVVVKMAARVLDILNAIKNGDKCEGNILGFLTGIGPIEECVKSIKEEIHKKRDLRAREIEVYPLYTQLPQESLDRALERMTTVVCKKILKILSTHDTKNGLRILALLLDDKSAKDTPEELERVYKEEVQKNANLRRVNLGKWELTVLDSDQKNVCANERQIVFTTHDKLDSLDHTAFDKVVTDRRVIISTNVAETSLTIDGIVYVIDSGLINQSQWDSELSADNLTAIFHSQAGCRQRWGRAGRVRDGEAHMLYTDDQFEKEFLPHTTPEIQRSSLDQIVLKAKKAGIENLLDDNEFKWIQRPEETELIRSSEILKGLSALDDDGDLTDYGLELDSFATDVPVADQLILADQYACGLEMATLAAVLNIGLKGGMLMSPNTWDFESKEAFEDSLKKISEPCRDDMELLLKIFSIWAEAGDEDEREYRCRFFYIDGRRIQEVAVQARNNYLEMLSVGKKSEEDRPVNFGLLDKLRIILAMSLPDDFIYKYENGTIRPLSGKGGNEITIGWDSIFSDSPPECFIALKRKVNERHEGERGVVKSLQLSTIVKLEPAWLDLRNCKPLESAFRIAGMLEAKKEKQPGMYRHRLFLDVNYPPGACYAKTGDASGNPIAGKKIKNPEPRDPVIEEGEIDCEEKPFEKESHDISATAGLSGESARRITCELTEKETYPLPDIEVDDEIDNDNTEMTATLSLSDASVAKAGTEADDTIQQSLIETDEIKSARKIIPLYRWRGAEDSDTTTCVVAEHDFTDPKQPVTFLEDYDPEKEKTEAKSNLQVGQKVRVEVIGVRALSNGREKALTVKELGSGSEFIVEVDRLAFADQWELVENFKTGMQFEMIVERGQGGRRELSLLPIDEEKVHEALKDIRKHEIEAEVILIAGYKIYFSIFAEDAGFSLPIGICRISLLRKKRNDSTAYETGKKYSVKIDGDTGKAGVFIYPRPDGLMEFIEKEKAKCGVIWVEKTEELRTTRPMTIMIRDKLLEISDKPLYQKEIKTLYRLSNQIEVYKPVSPQNIISKKKSLVGVPEYQPGEYVDGRIFRIYDHSVLVSLDRGGVGKILLRHLSKRRLVHPKEVVAINDSVKVWVMRQYDDSDGQNRIDLTMLLPYEDLKEKYPEGSIHEVTIIEIKETFALAELEKGAGGHIDIREIDYKYINNINDFLKIGQKVKVKVKNFKEIKDKNGNEFIINLSMKRALYCNKWVNIPVNKIGLLIGREGRTIKRLQEESKAKIIVKGNGRINIVVDYNEPDSLDRAIEGIRKVIPEMQSV